jgi:TPR repeat protein
VGASGDIDRARQAAEHGGPVEMIAVGRLLHASGDPDGAVEWFRRAADEDSTDAMIYLANLLNEMGNVDQGETWYRRAAAAGNTDAMFYVGQLCFTRGDLDGAEAWYRRAAEGGDVDAMFNVGYRLNDRGDLTEAESWYRRAADEGHAGAMNNLGYLRRDQGDLVGAEAWYRRAAEAGSTRALENLGYLFEQRGDLAEAEIWYRRGAEAGSAYAMDALGMFRKSIADLEGAEPWFRRGAEGGNAHAMANLGYVLQHTGDLAGAEIWYRRAIEAGETGAADGLAVLRRKIDVSDRQLDSVSFDTFGWKMSCNADGTRQWRDNDASLSERFTDLPPDFPSWDLDEMREAVVSTLELIQSPDFHFEDLDLPDQLQKHLPATLAEQARLLDINLCEIQTARCVLTTIRQIFHGEVRYSAGIMLLFAECYWSLALEVKENPLSVGEREGAAARMILEASTTAEIPTDEFDPYDRKWDGLVPIEQDPLTRVRLLADRLRDSIELDDRLTRLARFAPLDG